MNYFLEGQKVNIKRMKVNKYVVFTSINRSHSQSRINLRSGAKKIKSIGFKLDNSMPENRS